MTLIYHEMTEEESVCIAKHMIYMKKLKNFLTKEWT